MIDPQKLENITPDNVHKYIQNSAKGDRANVLINDPLLRSAWENVKKDLNSLLLRSTPGTADAMKWHYMYQALEAVEHEVESYIAGGKEASHILNAIAEMEKEEVERHNAQQRIWVDPPAHKK